MGHAPRRSALWPLLALLVTGSGGSAADDASSGGVDFDRDVRPILAKNCFKCHGPDEGARQAELRLDRREGVLRVAQPGDLEASELYRRITDPSPKEHMPPPDSGKVLSADEIARLSTWIEEGLVWGEHWSFVPPRRPGPPEVRDEEWVRDPLDRFVLARLEERGLAPSPPASREKLLRRVSFDLTGLPPTPAELDAFLADERPEAFAEAVDRLLASPRYGEHMAAWWLDGARYADTNGYQNDFARAMWPWRDWVIEAFNANMPYDEFVVEQLGGDLLPDATLSQRVATGFNRNHRMVTEAGSIDEEWRVENVIDRVDTTATVFLGLTMGCARCHDHKYDPITQRDFYRFYAYFDNVAEKGVYTEVRGNVDPLVRVPRPEDEEALAAIERRRIAAEADLARAEEAAAGRLDEWRAALRAEPRPEPPAATLHVASVPVGGEPAPVRSVAPHVSLAGVEGSFADLGQAVTFEEDRPFTVSLWFLAEAPGALVAKMADDDTYRGFDLQVTEDHRLFSHLIHDWPENAIKVVTTESVALGRWTHVALTYDGSRKAAGVHVYVEGREATLEVASDTLDGTIRTETPLWLGRRRYSPDYKGAIADLSFHEGVLGADEREILRHARLHELMALADADPAVAGAREELDQLLTSAFAEGIAAARAELDGIERERAAAEAAIPTSMVMAEREERRPTYLLRRGRYDAPEGEPLEPGLPEFLGVAPEDQPRDRLQLARWIVSPADPLAARVVVNQIWQRLFGIGLVETAENFGIQGTRPSDQELLDWLATGLVEDGWDLKALQKRIVTSATYRQRSSASDERYRDDPQNRWLARGPRHRLTAEEIRDQALAVSGLLVERIGGPPTRPYQPARLWEELAGGAGQGPYVQDTGDGLYRRSLYIHRKRTVPHPELSIFDAPSFEVCQVRRSRTDTPLQALALLNDVTYVEAARAFAQRMLREGGTTPEERLAFGFRAATSRRPSATELARLLAGLSARLGEYAQDPDAAAELVAAGDSEPDASLDQAELAAYTLTAGVLLNLDETITEE